MDRSGTGTFSVAASLVTLTPEPSAAETTTQYESVLSAAGVNPDRLKTLLVEPAISENVLAPASRLRHW
jgi:hypothetical protein